MADTILIAAIPSILSGVVLWFMKKNYASAEKKQAERDEREELTLESLNAIFSVTKELVDCTLYGKKPNGELEEAYKYKQETKHKLEDYYRRRAART
jgi:hypothetical protein